ncbi:protein of unknown function [Vibrio tapetis subsp. tapetis]|uniref:Uncharacterized protein n=1 Tax=Vibrio tapetis subsp. tapetis TaxID=1671868 RepID=A0A2N8ZK80_9VIBR|nr:protein of unknown function [Vibrio tapetis subsp. tapetis]
MLVNIVRAKVIRPNGGQNEYQARSDKHQAGKDKFIYFHHNIRAANAALKLVV